MQANRCITALLIAASLLTAGLALAGTPNALASETEEANATEASSAESRAYEGNAEPDRPSEEQGPRNLTLQGQLVDADTGEPVPDIQLTIHNRWVSEDEHHGGAERLTARTNGTGHYSIDVSQGDIRLSIDVAAYQLVRSSFDIEDDLTLDVPLEPVAKERAHIRGTVTSEDGEALSTANLRIFASSQDREEYHHERRDSREQDSREVETEQGTIVLSYEPRDDRSVYVHADEDGVYEAVVPAGSYVVHARAEDHLSDRTEIDAGEGEQVQANISLTRIPGPSVTLEGTVVDADSQEPIEHARISVDNQRWGTYEGARTDEDGSFSMEVRPGYAIVEIRAHESYYVPCEEPHTAEDSSEDNDEGDTATATSSTTPQSEDCDSRQERDRGYFPRAVTIQSSANETIEISPALEPEPVSDARIEGWILNASSQEPIEGVQVMVRNELTRDWGRAATGEDGSFALDVSEGYYSVRVRADGYFMNATNLQVEEGETHRTTLELTPGQAAGGCCYHAEPVAESSASADRSAGGLEAEDGASMDASAAIGDTSSGEQAFEGGPGDLGPHPSISTQGDPGQAPVPAPGAAALAAILGSIALARRARN